MWLLHTAMRRPITVVLAIVGVALCSILAIRRMKADIFPELGTPVIYVAQPYGGMDPSQMEGYLVNYYEYHFLYVSGIDYVESRSIQGAAIMKLYFHEGTDMAQAMAETVAQVNRARAFMPPGTVPPFVTRFDAGSVPVGYLVFSSETRGVDEISDLALFRVRPMFSRLPGVSAPPPFGGTARSLVVRVDPEKLRAYGMSPDEVVQAIAKTNTLSPSGNVRIGDLNRIAPLNATVAEAAELNGVPIRQGAGARVYLRDVGYAEDAADILTSYALVDGRRAVYIAATKRADASTLDVVQQIKGALASFQGAIPEDIKVSFELDQSFYVANALQALLRGPHQRVADGVGDLHPVAQRPNGFGGCHDNPGRSALGASRTLGDPPVVEPHDPGRVDAGYRGVGRRIGRRRRKHSHPSGSRQRHGASGARGEPRSDRTTIAGDAVGCLRFCACFLHGRRGTGHVRPLGFGSRVFDGCFLPPGQHPGSDPGNLAQPHAENGPASQGRGLLVRPFSRFFRWPLKAADPAALDDGGQLFGCGWECHRRLRPKPWR